MSLLSQLRRAVSSLPVLKPAQTALHEVEQVAKSVEARGGELLHSVERAASHVIHDVFESLRPQKPTGNFQSAPHAQLALKADFSDTARVEKLAASGAFERVSLEALPLDRSAVTGTDRGPNPALPPTGMHHQTPRGFAFDAEDSKTSRWMPQAVTTTADADPKSGTLDGKKWVAVTWHSDDGKRSRISFVDDTHDGSATLPYRNVELMVPDAKGQEMVPLASHVGGVSWVGHYLYVAQTGGGVRVFDANQLMQVKDPSRVPAGTSPYVLPQVGYYRVQPAPGEKPHAGSGSSPLFSGLSVDHTGATPALLSQEYDDAHPGGRIVRWPIDPSTGALQTDAGVVHATDAWSVPLKRLAGIVRLKDGFRLATMGTPSGLWTARDGQPPQQKDALAQGIQQFSYDATQNKIWTVAEHPGRRMVWTFSP